MPHQDNLFSQGQETDLDSIPYLNADISDGRNRNVYFETYGCQMNVNDTEIAWSILQKNGFLKVNDIANADVVLVVTCSIRENAEKKIWNRLEQLQHLKNRRPKNKTPLKIGLLGCMAERLKRKIVERSKIVDVVAGPDAYRDLPRLLSETDSGQAAINVILSMDETYADVIPVRLNQEAKSAFVSIMRGCDNMCSYCIVPFTRGRERSRPISSILEEVRSLSGQGVKEVTLLGQNVNSYRDTSESSYYGFGVSDVVDEATSMARGFNTIYKSKKGGLRFSYLLKKVSEIDPEMRIRFTSPHPKDFPDEVLHMIKERPNICNQLHLPAQSGNSDVLHRMRRGYTREAYIELVDHVQRILPDVSLSSDFITGFCGETEAEHQDTLSLLRLIKYNYAFLFAYSMRQKTHAYHKMKDDVPEEVKQRRLQEIISISRIGMAEMNAKQIGTQQLVLIEGKSKKSVTALAGRNDGNIRVIIPGDPIAVEVGSKVTRPMQPGDYVVVKVTDSTSQVLKGLPLYHSTLQGYHSKENGIR
ncbi:mitochondrial tRNA methylthiotransferase CDK5RAP1-like [Amphiura filiformis]|uniref:mitochondrial tRNA methylthiotransferase CDK5RAP1-like n=1 Tax=Amphiura filiformis TaxID=82378 RepID=UPI003B21434E